MKKSALLVCLLMAPHAVSWAATKPDSLLTDYRVFTGGEITVTGKKAVSNETVTAVDMMALDKTDVAKAVNILPGVNLGNAGSRNEGMIYVRGFDMRQVPIYLDGMPLYVPYDGYVDPNRFTTFDLAEVTVSKGYTSVLYGPNTLGGAINMLSRKPEKTFEGSVSGGMSAGNDQIASQFGSVNLGSKQASWYVQAGISSLDRDFVQLSGDFKPVTNEDGGKRDNSQTNDLKGSIKVGYTPNSTDEYVLSFSGQHSTKGVPVYAGINPTVSTRYWKYSAWDKASLHYIGHTSLGTKSYLKTRAYYDSYYNVLDSYDDNTYTTQTKKYAFSSIYDDKTFGGSVEYGSEFLADNITKFAVHDKYDSHRSYNVGSTPTSMADNTISLATENSWSASSHLNVVLGVRQDFRHTVKAEDLQTNVISSFPLADNQATNVQLALVGKIDGRQDLTAYVTRTTRFPTLKDRYSYKFGTAQPNPDLKPEQSVNYGLDYSIKPSDDLHLTASVYQSKLSDVIQQVNNVAYINNIWVYQFQNTGKATFSGVEFSADWQSTDWLKTYVSYGYIDRENDSNPDLYFVDVPKNKVFGYLQFQLDKDAWAMVEGEYNSKRYSTSDGKYTAGAYGLMNLRLHVPVYASMTVQASVENVFDRNYQVAEGYPEAGRTYVMSLAYAL